MGFYIATALNYSMLCKSMDEFHKWNVEKEDTMENMLSDSIYTQNENRQNHFSRTQDSSYFVQRRGGGGGELGEKVPRR